MKRGLTPTQAGELWRAASALPATAREAFFAAVDGRLVGIRRPLTDDDVNAAIVTVLGDSQTVTTHVFCCDAAPPQEANMAATNYDDDDDPFDHNGILKDGHKVRVSMQMRDAAMTRDTVASLFDTRRPGFVTADVRRRRKITSRDPFGHETGTEEEWEDAASAGPTYDIEAGRARKLRAYQEMCDEATNAWRNLTPMFPADVGEGEPRGAGPGDACTLNGRPGRLNEKLECIVDRQRDAASVPRTMTVDEARAIKRAAYDEMVRESQNAWRNL